MIEWFKNLFNKFFPKKVDYKALYENQLAVSQNWEYKYNKIARQLREIVQEHNL